MNRTRAVRRTVSGVAPGPGTPPWRRAARPGACADGCGSRGRWCRTSVDPPCQGCPSYRSRSEIWRRISEGNTSLVRSIHTIRTNRLWNEDKSFPFFFKIFWGGVLFGNPVLDFYWRLPWSSKSWWIPCLHASLPVCNGFSRFTSFDSRTCARLYKHWWDSNFIYRPQTKLWKGNVFTPVCQSFCSQGGHVCQGACGGGMCARGRAWQGGACMARGACMAGKTATAADGTHPTGMLSCLTFAISLHAHLRAKTFHRDNHVVWTTPNIRTVNVAFV